MPTDCLTSHARIPKKALLLVMLATSLTIGRCDDHSDRLLDLLVKKGMLTQEEANNFRAEEQMMGTNRNVMPESKWKISNAIKSIEIYGDVRLRFEDRTVHDPSGGRIELERFRYALRLGVRGDVFDDFYYGFRLDTASNPRSPWVTFGTSSSGTPYQGPFGKSTAGIDIGQLYIGWRPTSWLDLTFGKMPNPLYTTPMVWDSDLNPEGFAERFKYQVGNADFFATFGQFVYADVNPNYTSGGYGINGLIGQDTDTPFQLAFQGGVNHHFTTNFSAKIAATLYHYVGLHTNTVANVGPFFGDTFVGEGQYTGSGFPLNGASGYGTSGSIPGASSVGFPNNQVGVENLLILEIPAEVNFKIGAYNARVFGDYAYNLEGSQRAEKAAGAYASYLNSQPIPPTISAFSPQRNDVHAYQIGFALSNKDNLGMVYGTTSRKHAWELRSYWQHIEQYALDPNLLDSDFFEGRGNLEGFYAALAYCFTDNVIGTFRYGYAHRINDKLGTGGSNQDIPQMNPIERYNLLQLDLTLRF